MISYTDPYSGTLIEYDPETKRRVLELEGGPVIHTLPGGGFSVEDFVLCFHMFPNIPKRLVEIRRAIVNTPIRESFRIVYATSGEVMNAKSVHTYGELFNILGEINPRYGPVVDGIVYGEPIDGFRLHMKICDDAVCYEWLAA